MHKIKIQERIKYLEILLDEIYAEHADIEGRILDLEGDLFYLENEEAGIIKEIKDLKTRLSNMVVSEVDDTLTGDEFRDAFIKCSWFCRRQAVLDDVVPYWYEHIRITNSRLVGSDGYRAISIKCDSIPENLKNTYIRWDVRNNFTENANPTSIVGASNYLKTLDKLMQQYNDNKILLINESKFKEMFYHESRKQSDKNIIILKLLGVKVAFNQDYLETMLRAFKNMDIEVYCPECWHEPIMIRSQYQSALLLPMRL
ncbi:MAG TPA: hypothetical protein GXX70_00050 [Tepidimicrobium sp.]|nr:hypothetical protein [Tepidimicrobium sp.]